MTDDLYQEGDSWAVFGQASFSISETLTLTTGVRFNNENKDGGGDLYQFQFGPPGVVNPFFKAVIDEDDTTGMVSLQNDFSEVCYGLRHLSNAVIKLVGLTLPEKPPEIWVNQENLPSIVKEQKI